MTEWRLPSRCGIGMTSADTDSKKRTCVVDSEGNVMHCTTHVQFDSTKNLYLKMRNNSAEYDAWVTENSTENRAASIGFTKFTQAKCKCIVQEKQRDCADVLDVSMRNLLKAWNYLREKVQPARSAACTCCLHQCATYTTAHENGHALLRHTLCAEVVHPGVERLLGDNNGERTVTDAQAEALNVQNAVQKVGEKRSQYIGKAHTDTSLKRVKCIATPSASTHLRTFARPCSYGTCAVCGVGRRLPLTCPVDNDPNVVVTVREFQVVKRGNREQKEIVEVRMSAAELLQKIVALFPSWAKHQWDKRWDLHTRRLVLETFGPTTLVVQTDFAATTDLNPQDRVNSAIAGHAIQAVFMVSHSPELVTLPNGYRKRVIQNDVFHCWGEETKGRLTNDNYFSTCSLKRIIRYYKHTRNMHITHLLGMSDGCAAQYKCRKQPQALVRIGREEHLMIDWVYAPTASFKTPLDSMGNHTKAYLRKCELREVEGTRAKDARAAFGVVQSMGQPILPTVQNRTLHTQTSRHHLFLVDRTKAVAEDYNREDIIVTDYENEKWDCKPLPSIQSIYHIHVPETALPVPHVQFRAHFCRCTGCRAAPPTPCLYTAVFGPPVWKCVKEIPVNEIAHNAQEADFGAVLEELEAEQAQNNLDYLEVQLDDVLLDEDFAFEEPDW